MSVSMTLATEREGSKNKRVLIHEPFPALNTTDAFIVDRRTAEILERIFDKYKITRKTGLELVVCEKDEQWAQLKI